MLHHLSHNFFNCSATRCNLRKDHQPPDDSNPAPHQAQLQSLVRTFGTDESAKLLASIALVHHARSGWGKKLRAITSPWLKLQWIEHRETRLVLNSSMASNVSSRTSTGSCFTTTLGAVSLRARRPPPLPPPLLCATQPPTDAPALSSVREEKKKNKKKQKKQKKTKKQQKTQAEDELMKNSYEEPPKSRSYEEHL